MTCDFHPEAEAEFLSAINHYEGRNEGLGHDFAIEVYATIHLILEHPRAWQILDIDVRRCQTPRFPYGVIYSEEPDGIFILAVMHLHQDPDYWRTRLL